MLFGPPTLTELDGLEHLGWRLSAEYDREDHEVIRADYRATRNGESVWLDWSPYHQFKPRHFTIMVECGFPRRDDIAPLSPRQVEALPEQALRLAEDVRELSRGSVAA